MPKTFESVEREDDSLRAAAEACVKRANFNRDKATKLLIDAIKRRPELREAAIAEAARYLVRMYQADVRHDLKVEMPRANPDNASGLTAASVGPSRRTVYKIIPKSKIRKLRCLNLK